ncbi:MAG: mannose-1-phosphate guanylyltransferase/mannose-6-phosphate isomerase, partial [Aquificota bacterium]
MKVLILAGGSGTRLWPLSREKHPKQFLKLFEGKSFLKLTYERALRLVDHKDIVIVTNEEYQHKVVNDLYPYEGYSVIVETYRRNTGPAVALGLLYIKEFLMVDDEEVVAVLASDHLIKPEESFVEYMKFAEDIAKEGYLVTFGVKPTRPEVNFGYIRAGGTIEEYGRLKAYTIDEFIEKPERERAEKMLKEGFYFWNSGNFVFKLGVVFDEYRLNAPEIYGFMLEGYHGFLENYSRLPDISFDYIEMEKTKRGAVVPMDIFWSDVGSFDGLYSIMEKDERDNACVGRGICLDSEGNLVYSNGKLVCLVDIQDTVVVEDRDAVLVMRRGSAAKVRDVVRLLKEKGLREAYYHLEKSYEWGTELLLESGDGYRIHKVSILPGRGTGLRMHMHHSRSWTVLRGTLQISIGSEKSYYTSGESFHAYRTT